MLRQWHKFQRGSIKHKVKHVSKWYKIADNAYVFDPQVIPFDHVAPDWWISNRQFYISLRRAILYSELKPVLNIFIWKTTQLLLKNDDKTVKIWRPSTHEETNRVIGCLTTVNLIVLSIFRSESKLIKFIFSRSLIRPAWLNSSSG